MIPIYGDVMRKPEVYLSNADECVDEDGNVVERTQKFLQKFASAVVDFAGK